MARKKKRPEFELPAVLIAATQEYLGTGTVNKLSADQASRLMAVMNYAASQVGFVLEQPDAPAAPPGKPGGKPAH